MSGMGPAPKDPSKRARRNPSLAMTMLPAGGWTGEIPDWPLPDDPKAAASLDVARGAAEKLRDEWAAAEDSNEARKIARRLETAEVQVRMLELILEQRRELEGTLWKQLWRTPQAAMWSRLGWTREVAQYVRHKALGELGDLDNAKEARLLSGVLGLNPMAMLRLRWQISPDEVGEKRAANNAEQAPASGSRGRRGPLRDVSKAAGDD